MAYRNTRTIDDVSPATPISGDASAYQPVPAQPVAPMTAEQYLVKLHLEQSRQIEDLRCENKGLTNALNHLMDCARIVGKDITINRYSDGSFYIGMNYISAKYEKDQFAAAVQLFGLQEEIDKMIDEEEAKKEADDGDKVEA